MRTLALVAALGLLAGCASTPAARPEPAPEVAQVAPAPKAPGEAQLGDRTTCPTSAEEFVVEADSPRFEYRGKTFFVCCEGCLDDLKEDPERYLGKYLE